MSDEEMNPFSALFGSNYSSVEEMQAARDRSKMEASAAVHEIADFLRGLSRKDADTFKTILYMSSDSKQYAHYILGMMAAFGETRFGICAACNKNHEEELLPEASKEPGKHISEATENEQMDLYNLRFPLDGEVESGQGDKPVICKGCNMLYQSLEDRMLRVPGIDGCNGCQLRSAHG